MDKNNFKIDYTKYDTYALAVKFKNISEDLTKAFFTVKENPDDKPIIQKSLGAGISKISDKPYKKEKTYKLQLESLDSKEFDIDVQYLYDLQVTIGGVVKTVISGFFVVRKSISDYPNVTTQEYDVEVADEVETELQTTPATNGVEYEVDPIATEMIGELAKLETSTKTNIVKAINEVNLKTNDNATANANISAKVEGIISGATEVSKATNSNYSNNSGYADNSGYATNSGKINNLEIIKDSNGVLKIDNVIIPQKQIIASNLTYTGENIVNNKLPIDDYNNNEIYELECELSNLTSTKFYGVFRINATDILSSPYIGQDFIICGDLTENDAILRCVRIVYQGETAGVVGIKIKGFYYNILTKTTTEVTTEVKKLYRVYE